MRRRARLRPLLWLGAWALWAGAVAALELPLPRGAQAVFSEATALDSYALPVGPFASGHLPVETLEGAVRRQAFQIDNDSITLLQIIAPLRESLVAEGFEIRLDCDEMTCGGFDFRFATEVVPAPAMFVDLTRFRFLSARSDAAALSVLVSGSATRRYLQVIQVGLDAPVAPSETRPVTLSVPPNAQTGDPDSVPPAPTPGSPRAIGLSDVGVALETAGRVVLDDLNFETGRTTLSQGTYASLEALAAYLRANPGAGIALVGHTDAVGGLEGNIAISQDRAGAVRSRLIEAHGVPAAQISARGVGFLSPRASNLTEAGRADNRRVEAVLLSTE